MKIIITYATGLIFGLGIVISGMASPAKVLNFFDVAGSWAPAWGWSWLPLLASPYSATASYFAAKPR